MFFMQRDPIHQVEKPYELNYKPEDGQPKTNMTMERATVAVTDIRPATEKYSFETHGFELVTIDGPVGTRLDFDDPAQVIQVYFPAVASIIQRRLGAERVQVFDHTNRANPNPSCKVRKRHEKFPISTGGFYEYKQPSTIVHVDTTPRQTRELIQKMNPPEEAKELLQRRYQYVNIWKPLHGPVLEWPLAVCDPGTVDKSDYIARDFVEVDSYMETYHLYQRPSHKWYYVSSQSEQEAWVFLQSDSAPNAMRGVPHCSILVPQESKTHSLPRESIEVRALVFYGKEKSGSAA
ncbi:hypothetical protein K3495_g742 [Podosphaera aphanis]|nr:hypothetical protein K3495_g742 [Podosphaera aphanis]